MSHNQDDVSGGMTTNPGMSRMGKAALAYAERGWAVLPLNWVDEGDDEEPVCSCRNPDCPRPAKHPLLAKGVKQASSDPAQVTEWWSQWPDANIGVATGRISGLLVLDLDGVEADETIESNNLELPEGGPVVSTGKGRHYYMTCPEDGAPNKVKMLPGLDLRGDGGYVVAPPSTHFTGRKYKWTAKPEQPLASVPGWVIDLINEQHDSTGKLPEKIGDGERNDTLARLGGYLRRKGMSVEAIFAALQIENQNRCQPPLPDDEVMVIAKSVGRYKPEQEEVEVERPSGNGTTKKGRLPRILNIGRDDEQLTDVGNANRFLREYGRDLLYLPARGKWMFWNDHYWKLDDECGHVSRLAQGFYRLVEDEAALRPSKAERLLLTKHAKDSQSVGKIKAFLALAQELRRRSVDAFDRDPHLFGVVNGVVDLRTGQLVAPTHDQLISRLSPVAYDPDAKCPRWLEVLDYAFGGNRSMIDWLQKAFGYATTGDTSKQCFFVFYGTGANSKSTILETVKGIMGDYARTSNFATFADNQKNNNGPSEDIARLAGARFVTAIESNTGINFAEALLKQLTGSERVSARYLYQETFEFTPQMKIFFGTNHKPGIKGGDEGIWRRIRLVPFKVIVPEERREKDLSGKLLATEAEGILAWLVQGAMRWYAEGLGQVDDIRQATAQYRSAMDVFSQFLSECCIEDELARPGTLFSDLYKAYTDWCEPNGEKALSRKWFGIRLDEVGKPSVKQSGSVYRPGLRLRDDQPQKASRMANQTPFGTMLSGE